MSSIIEIKNLHYTYPGDEMESLCGVSLEIEKGSFVAVLGHNGSGKSTLAKHLNAILLPTEGKVLINGIDTAAQELLAQDPELELQEHAALKAAVERLFDLSSDTLN